MSKTYWVWKDPSRAKNQNNPDWIQMNRQEFGEFLKSPKSENRYFIDFADFKVESTKEEYDRWRSEANHSRYLKKYRSAFDTVFCQDVESRDGHIGDEVIGAEDINIEEIINEIEISQLKKNLCQLSESEYEIIYELYLREKPKTIRELACEKQVHFTSINERKLRILAKLQNFPSLQSSKRSASK